MNEPLQQEHQAYAIFLLKNLEDAIWRESKLRHADKMIVWLPLARVEDTNSWLGLSKSGHWVLEIDGLVDYLNQNDMRGVWPCLKKPYQQFAALLTNSLIEQKLPPDLANTFPYRALVISALGSQIDFWANLDLNWLSHIDQDQETIAMLESLINARWATQQTRQKASKQLRNKV